MTPRITSIQFTPNATRETLRARLRHYLSGAPREPFRTSKAGVISLRDEDILDVLLATRDVNCSHIVTQEGYGNDRSAEVASDANGAVSAPTAAEVIEAVRAGRLHPADVACSDPRWVAARLWERSSDMFDGPPEQFQFWLDRWSMLGSPAICAHLDWCEPAYRRFVDVAFQAIQTEFALADWSTRRAQIVRQYAGSAIPEDEAESKVPPVPDTWVGRARWVTDLRLDEQFDDDVWAVVWLLLHDVATTAWGSAPHEVARRLFDDAFGRPDLLTAVLQQCSNQPAVLADMLLYVPTCALGCYVVSETQVQVASWDRPLLEPDAKSDLLRVFTDAIDVLSFFLSSGEAIREEAAALLACLNVDREQPFRADRAAMRDVMRARLAEQPRDLVLAVVSALAQRGSSFHFGSPEYDAALDLVARSGLETARDGDRFVDGYSEALSAATYSLSARRINDRDAATLLEIAASVGRMRAVLHALPSLPPASTVLEDEWHRRVRAVRVHTRVLSRAIVGMPSVAENVIDALELTLRSGARDDHGAGLVAAFSGRYETWPLADGDRPLGFDVAAAISAVQGDWRLRLVGALTRTDEPLILAQVAPRVPVDAAGPIVERLRALTPADAADVVTLPEAQARVNALLDAELPDVASLYMDEETRLATLGPVRGRELDRFRSLLRVRFLRREWPEIMSATVPSDLAFDLEAAAIQTLWFFKGLAHIVDANGDLDAAVSIFDRLRDETSDDVAIAVNWFAARLQQLIKRELFVRFGTDDAREGEALLTSIERRVIPLCHDEQSRRVVNGNLALLLLALGRPGEALPLSRAHEHEDPRAAAATAVALSRLGHVSEAMSVLAAARNRFGGMDAIRSAQNELDDSAGAVPASPGVVAMDDQVLRVQAALYTLLTMDPASQARVLHPAGDIDALLTGYVRNAGASLIELAVFFPVAESAPSEDYLNALLREMLVGHARVTTWSLNDESRGGYSVKLGPGRRDIRIMSAASTLAVIEAVVCRDPPHWQSTRANLAEHFGKLFGYTTAKTLFHVTYCFVDDVPGVMAVLKDIARSEVPSPFAYVEHTDITTRDSAPDGFAARYRNQSGVWTVVFLVLDLGQGAQRTAAVESRTQ